LYVVGATKAEYFTEVRKIVPNSFISAWVGAQAEAFRSMQYGMNDNIVACWLILQEE
jgi:orotidine-5'-phosphate decarboxylase